MNKKLKKVSLILSVMGMFALGACGEDEKAPNHNKVDVPGGCTASCHGNHGVNCDEEGKAVSLNCNDEAPVCQLSEDKKRAVCVKGPDSSSGDGKGGDGVEKCKERCSDSLGVAYQCDASGNEVMRKCSEEGLKCKMEGEKSVCKKPCVAGCSVDNKSKSCPDGEWGAEKVVECKGNELCKVNHIDENKVEVVCKPKCEVRCEKSQDGKNVAINCPEGAIGDMKETKCEGDKAECKVNVQGTEASCKSKEEVKQCESACKGQVAVQCPSGEKGEAKEVDCSKKGEICKMGANGAVCDKKVEFKIPEKWLGATCSCTGCESMGVPTPKAGTITGCENVKVPEKDKGSYGQLACMRSYEGDVAPKTYFGGGYCTNISIKCEGNALVCNQAKFGDYDKTTKCLENSVMIDMSFDATLLGVMKASFWNKTCAPVCQKDEDCRVAEGYKCLEKDGKLANGSSGKVKFCYDPRNFPENVKSLTFTAF